MVVVRRVVALVVAVALAATGAMLIIEVVAAWVGRGPVLLADTATATWRTMTWDDPTVRWVAIAVGVAGIVCLVVAGWRDVPATVATTIVDVELERRPLEQALQRQLVAVDGVADATVTARPGHTRVVVTTNRMIDDGSIEAASRACLHDAASRFGLGSVDVTVRAPRAQRGTR